MGKTALTPEQDLIVRRFYEKVVQADPVIFAGTNTTPRVAQGVCLALLGYVLVNGKHIAIDRYKQANVRYGQKAGDAFEDEYEDDKDRNQELYYEAATEDTHRSEADSRVTSEGSKVREAVFCEDI